MGYRADRLREMLRVKGWEPADLHRATGIAYAPLGRYLRVRTERGAGAPSVDTIGKLVLCLELDANYLIDTDAEYADLPPLRAAARMSLQRYLAEERIAKRAVAPEDENALRHIAHYHSDPPLWVRDWRRQHESLSLTIPRSAVTSEPHVRRRIRRMTT